MAKMRVNPNWKKKKIKKKKKKIKKKKKPVSRATLQVVQKEATDQFTADELEIYHPECLGGKMGLSGSSRTQLVCSRCGFSFYTYGKESLVTGTDVVNALKLTAIDGTKRVVRVYDDDEYDEYDDDWDRWHDYESNPSRWGPADGLTRPNKPNKPMTYDYEADAAAMRWAERKHGFFDTAKKRRARIAAARAWNKADYAQWRTNWLRKYSFFVTVVQIAESPGSDSDTS